MLPLACADASAADTSGADRAKLVVDGPASRDTEPEAAPGIEVQQPEPAVQPIVHNPVSASPAQSPTPSSIVVTVALGGGSDNDDDGEPGGTAALVPHDAPTERGLPPPAPSPTVSRGRADEDDSNVSSATKGRAEDVGGTPREEEAAPPSPPQFTPIASNQDRVVDDTVVTALSFADAVDEPTVRSMPRRSVARSVSLISPSEATVDDDAADTTAHTDTSGHVALARQSAGARVFDLRVAAGRAPREAPAWSGAPSRGSPPRPPSLSPASSTDWSWPASAPPQPQPRSPRRRAGLAPPAPPLTVPTRADRLAAAAEFGQRLGPPVFSAQDAAAARGRVAAPALAAALVLHADGSPVTAVHLRRFPHL